jgi:hypothetical protein
MVHNQIYARLKYQYCRDRSYTMDKAALSMLLLLVALAGCAINMDIHMGSRPNIPAIEQRLHIGQSTTDDVLAVLGPPRGKGRAMLPIDPKQRILWSYVYLEGSVKTGGESKGDMRSLMLFVFFDQDKYAGYMWFSSVPERGVGN